MIRSHIECTFLARDMLRRWLEDGDAAEQQATLQVLDDAIALGERARILRRQIEADHRAGREQQERYAASNAEYRVQLERKK